MERIIVIGSPGAGKSSFARSLAKKTRIPLFHLDMMWHKPDKTTVSREEFDAKLDDIMSEKTWIIDGNYDRTISIRLEKCDTVFLLDYPMAVCLAGAEARVGIPRSDMPWIEDALDPDLKARIEAFSSTSLPRIYKMLSECRSKEVHIFKSREDAKSFLAKK